MIDKIPVKEIRLQRIEGSIGLDSFDPVTVTTWAEANAILRSWAKTAPGPGQGYDKCDFTVTWQDGETYNGRYDLEGRETETADLAAHVMAHARFMAGQWRSWASPEQYAAILADHEKLTPGVTAEWAAFVAGYDLGGAELPRNHTV